MKFDGIISRQREIQLPSDDFQVVNLRDFCEVVELNGPFPGTRSVVSCIHFCTMDSAFPEIDNPCRIPNSGHNWSFAKTFAFKVNFQKLADKYGCYELCDIAMTRTNQTFEFYGAELFVCADPFKKYHGIPLRKYVPAQGTVGVTGDVINSYHPCALGRWLEPLFLNATYKVDSGSYYDDFTSKAVVAQLRIRPDALQGNVPYEHFEVRASIR
jgi:hypothetical protein